MKSKLKTQILELNEFEKEFIEKCGITYEKKAGLPRIAGKIIGFLLISDPQEQNLSEIQKAIKVSKASVSTMLRIIEKIGFIEKLSLHGKRTVYYRITALNEEFFKNFLDDNTEFKKLLEFGLFSVQKRPQASQKRIKEWLDFYQFMEEELPRVFQKWLRKNEKFNKIR